MQTEVPAAEESLGTLVLAAHGLGHAGVSVQVEPLRPGPGHLGAGGLVPLDAGLVGADEVLAAEPGVVELAASLAELREGLHGADGLGRVGGVGGGVVAVGNLGGIDGESVDFWIGSIFCILDHWQGAGYDDDYSESINR